jgi:hypothetical protein
MNASFTFSHIKDNLTLQHGFSFSLLREKKKFPQVFSSSLKDPLLHLNFIEYGSRMMMTMMITNFIEYGSRMMMTMMITEIAKHFFVGTKVAKKCLHGCAKTGIFGFKTFSQL